MEHAQIKWNDIYNLLIIYISYLNIFLKKQKNKKNFQK